MTCSRSCWFIISVAFSSNLGSIPFISNIFILLLIKLQLRPILYAVFILSPVNIHTFISASLKSLIVSGTFSCNLSSTIVVPIKYKSFSIFSHTSFSFFSLSTKDILASFNSLSNLLYSFSDKTFIAINKVLNPCELNSFTYSWHWANMFLFVWGLNLSFIIESAPLQYKIIFPSGVLTIIVSRFLSEENSNICNLLYCTFLILFSYPFDINLISGFPDSSYFHPCAAAALTNSILSGDTHIYSSFPSSLFSTEQVWHRDNAVQKCSIKLSSFSRDNFTEPSSLFII